MMAGVEARVSRQLVVGCAAAIAFTLTYALVDYARLPRLWHDQVARQLRWDTEAGGPQPAGYAGMWLWALAAAALAAGLAWAVLRLRGARPVSPPALGLWVAWTMTAFVLVGAYFTWNLWP
jgi:hypothetical protein